MLLPLQGVSNSTQTPQGVALGYELVDPAGRPYNKTVLAADSTFGRLPKQESVPKLLVQPPTPLTKGLRTDNKRAAPGNPERHAELRGRGFNHIGSPCAFGRFFT